MPIHSRPTMMKNPHGMTISTSAIPMETKKEKMKITMLKLLKNIYLLISLMMMRVMELGKMN